MAKYGKIWLDVGSQGLSLKPLLAGQDALGPFVNKQISHAGLI